MKRLDASKHSQIVGGAVSIKRARSVDVLIRGLGDIDTQVPVEIIGSATSRDQEILSSRLADVSEDVYITGGETALAPVMGRLVASNQYTPIRPDELQPLYVRPPDAVLVRERRGSRR